MIPVQIDAGPYAVLLPWVRGEWEGTWRSLHAVNPGAARAMNDLMLESRRVPSLRPARSYAIIDRVVRDVVPEVLDRLGCPGSSAARLRGLPGIASRMGCATARRAIGTCLAGRGVTAPEIARRRPPYAVASMTARCAIRRFLLECGVPGHFASDWDASPPEIPLLGLAYWLAGREDLVISVVTVTTQLMARITRACDGCVAASLAARLLDAAA